jgi:hypothetical protein
VRRRVEQPPSPPRPRVRSPHHPVGARGRRRGRASASAPRHRVRHAMPVGERGAWAGCDSAARSRGDAPSSGSRARLTDRTRRSPPTAMHRAATAARTPRAEARWARNTTSQGRPTPAECRADGGCRRRPQGRIGEARPAGAHPRSPCRSRPPRLDARLEVVARLTSSTPSARIVAAFFSRRAPRGTTTTARHMPCRRAAMPTLCPMVALGGRVRDHAGTGRPERRRLAGEPVEVDDAADSHP